MNMQKTDLIAKLKKTYPEINIEFSDDYKWSPSSNIVFIPKKYEPSYLLHEFGHGLCNHKDYDLAIDLVRHEQEAWDKAYELAKKFKVKIKDDLVADSMTSYYTWLHKRAICPKCHEEGLEIEKNSYKCFFCNCSWKVNEARQCNIKRTILKD